VLWHAVCLVGGSDGADADRIRRSRVEKELPMPVIKMVRMRAKSGIPRREGALVSFALLVGGKCTNNANLPNAGPLPGDVLDAADTFQQARMDMLTKKGTADARSAARQHLVEAINHLRDHINTVVEKLDNDKAKAVIESTGFPVKKTSVRVKPPLEVKYGGLEGTALLVALAAAHSAIYYFEYSSDQVHWVACPNVLVSHTSVSGLAVGTLYYFRVRAQTRKGLGDYSLIVRYLAR
jgi:hypothetical protein